jgi:energy-coupling factor transporter ATP-binding protein EcfA2
VLSDEELDRISASVTHPAKLPRPLARASSRRQPASPPPQLAPTPAPCPNPARADGDTSLIITKLSDLKAKPVRYLVPGRIPAGKLMLVAGRGGCGKSTWSRALAADISAGRCAFGLTYPDPVRGKVLIVAAEDGPADTILPGLLACGADVDRVAILEGVRHNDKRTDFTLLPEHVDLVRERLKHSPDIRLIIIDPIASFVGRSKVDDHRAAELRLVLDPLSALAEESGVAILLLAHMNKGSGEAVDRIAGSAAYRDAVRAAYLATEDPEDDTRRLMIPVKENLPGFDRSAIPFGLEKLTDAEAEAVLSRPQFADLEPEDRATVREQLRRVRFDAPVKVDPNEATAPKGKRADMNKVEKCAEWIKDLLREHAYPSQEIVDAAKLAGFTFDNVTKAKTRLKKDGLQNSNMGRLRGVWWSGFGHPATWALRPDPESAPESPDSHHSHYSPGSPDIGKPVGGVQCQETQESEETAESEGAFVLFPASPFRGLPD